MNKTKKKRVNIEAPCSYTLYTDIPKNAQINLVSLINKLFNVRVDRTVITSFLILNLTRTFFTNTTELFLFRSNSIIHRTYFSLYEGCAFFSERNRFILLSRAPISLVEVGSIYYNSKHPLLYPSSSWNTQNVSCSKTHSLSTLA